MESAIKTVVEVYLKNAGGKENLSGGNFQKLVKKQLNNIMTDTDSSKAITEMRQGLDDNQDGKVSFQEYMTLVGYLANTLSEQRVKEAQDKPAAEETPEAGDGAVAVEAEAEPAVAAGDEEAA